MQTVTEQPLPARYRHSLPLDRARRLEVIAARVSAWLESAGGPLEADAGLRGLVERWQRRTGVRVVQN